VETADQGILATTNSASEIDDAEGGVKKFEDESSNRDP